MFPFSQLLESPASGLNRAILSVKNHISKNKVYCPAKASKFVFLCGGFKDGKVSARRREIINFARKNLPNVKFFIAEDVFEILMKEGHKANLLDRENDISKFADKILIILESNGAFCELGAFSYPKDLRSKLIIINDERYKKSSSFIRLGPLEAIKEVGGDGRIIYYKMTEEPDDVPDAIGKTFSQLTKALHPMSSSSRFGTVSLSKCNPNKSFEKDTICFIHDLIFFTGPITYNELVKIVIKIFGSADYSPLLGQCIGLLVATQLIEKIMKD